MSFIFRMHRFPEAGVVNMRAHSPLSTTTVIINDGCLFLKAKNSKCDVSETSILPALPLTTAGSCLQQTLQVISPGRPLFLTISNWLFLDIFRIIAVDNCTLESFPFSRWGSGIRNWFPSLSTEVGSYLLTLYLCKYVLSITMSIGDVPTICPCVCVCSFFCLSFCRGISMGKTPRTLFFSI